jgi:hypothetical protein
MAGTRSGGQAAARTNKLKHGPDFYREIGAKGGRNGRTGGFAAGEEGRVRARVFGAIGGKKSKRVYTEEERKKAGEWLQAGRRAKQYDTQANN